MDTTLVPEYSANLPESVARAGNTESSKCSEEQNQSKTPAAPMRSAVRFKIRSAKERQQLHTKGSNFESETIEKVNKSIKESREEMAGVHPYSPRSLDPDMIDKRRTRTLNKISCTKEAELSISSEMSDTTQRKAEWRQACLSNRSKSLDWRGRKSEGARENQTVVIRNTKDFKGSSIRRSESLERKGATNIPNSNEMVSPLKKISLRIQSYNSVGQGNQDSSGIISSAVSGTSPVRMVALAQSLPSRLKSKQSHDRAEERRTPWQHYGHSGPDQAEDHLRSQVGGSKVNEKTGDQAMLCRIEKLYGFKVLEDNTDANSGVSHEESVHAKHNSAPVDDRFFSLDASNLNGRKSTNDSLVGWSSFSSFSKVRTISFNAEKCGTFPRTPSKMEGINFSSMPDTSFVLPNGKANLLVMSTCSKERPLRKDLTCLLTSNSKNDERTQIEGSIGLGTHSLDRARNRHITAPVLRALTTESSYSACDSRTPSNSMQESTRREMERQVEKMTNNSPQTKGMETIPGKQLHGSQEGVIAWTKPQSFQSMTADSEKHKEDEGVLEFGSSINPSKKRGGLLEKSQILSLDSVRNTIHKFEALAQQSQSPSQILHPRRASSVTEKPKMAVGVNKSYSNRSLGRGDWKRECLRENLFSKSDMEVSTHDLSRHAPITTTGKEGSTVKTQRRAANSQEPGVPQTLKLLDELPYDQNNKARDNIKDDIKFTMMNKHMDEPDFSKVSHQKLQNIESKGEKVRNYFNATVSQNSQKSSGSTNVSHPDLRDVSISKSCSKSTKDKTFQTSGSIPVLPNLDSSTSVKSTLLTGNSTHSKSPSNLLSDSILIPPIQVISSASGDLNNLYNTIKDKKVAAKVSRWIMDEGDGVNTDDENDEDEDDEDDEGTEKGNDSDSGESSITITSNMSHRSFSMSLVDLCNLGGLDLPPSDGSELKDEEMWMSRRSASLSSDVSALSSVTLLGMEELDCLLDDVRTLGDDALENYEDVHVVVLHKEAGSGLGFTVAGGVDQNKPVTVHRVIPCGAASQEGSIHEGDQVLSINGTALHNSTHQEARHTMRKARGRAMAVVVIRRGYITETCYSTKDMPQKVTGNPAGSRVRVTLNKSSSDLGFSLQGGVDSSLGDKPLTVQRLFQGGPVGKVFPGDELLKVQGQTLAGLRRLEVWNLIKRLPPGPVEVLLQRSHQLY